MRIRLGYSLALAVSALALGCGDDDDDKPATGGTGGTSATGGSGGSTGGSGGSTGGSGGSTGGSAGSTGGSAGSTGGTAGSTGGTAGAAGSAGSAGSGGAQGDMYRGGLIWDNWTKTASGGTALPTGVASTQVDFIRCKSCHGWDALGLDGGYVRRTSNANRPKPIGASNLSSKLGNVTETQVWYTNGHAWTVFNDLMPSFQQAEGLTASQVADVVAYLNNGPKVQDVATLDTTPNPVAYTFTNASTTAGATAYATSCQGCHGADGQGLGMSLGAYFVADGKYSEGFHKMLYGIPNTGMTRAAMNNLTADQTRDILAYIQANLGTTFPTN